MPSAPSGRRSPGRKRDASIEDRVTQAAIEVYAVAGWRGFSFESVARLSGIGKPALYRRWPSREAMLTDAFVAVDLPTARDLGSLRADVADYAEQWVRWYRTPFLAEAGSRIQVDGASNADLHRLYMDLVITPRGRAVREITRRAVARGELPPGTPPTLLPDLLMGAFFTHWSYAPDKAAFNDSLASYAERLVTTIITGLGGTP